MRRNTLNGIVTSLVLFLFVSISHAHDRDSDVYWHIDPTVKSCSMVIDPSLTQAQWHEFTKQAGAIISFKSLPPAKALGRLNFEIAIDNSYTPVDQHDLAWINTFTHPDEDCPLGDTIQLPTVRARMGITDNMDVGGYWTAAPDANYGAVGGELKYAFLQESRRFPALAVRGSFSILTDVPDFNFGTYSLDLIASKRFHMLTPYVGLRENLFVATETTTKVDLDQERLLVPQGYAGVACSLWLLNLAIEYNISSVNTFAIAIGCGH